MAESLMEQRGFDKRTWEAFAERICRRSDEEIIPLIPQMLEWMQDMNWPGAIRIANRLHAMPKEVVHPAVERTIRRAEEEHDEEWRINLQDWLLRR